MKNSVYALIFALAVFLNAVCIITLASERTTSDTVASKSLTLEEASVKSSPLNEPTDRAVEVVTPEIKLKLENGEIVTLDIEDYVEGVVAGEMYPSAPIEALRAMAVAARTYALYMAAENEEKDFHLTTSASSHQAYRSFDENDGAYENVRKAVEETKGEVVTYGGDIILALYHASSADSTEDCENVFIEALPYLASVNTPLENKESAYKSEKTLTLSEVNQILSSSGYPTLEGNVSVKSLKNENGRCKTLILSDARSGVFIDGRKVREIFSLRSSSFDIAFFEDELVFTVYGFGHGVGMSQNGAVILAENGKSYRQIQSGYYTDTNISNIVHFS